MPTDDDALERLARELYPGNAYLQQQWLRGVRLVRTTARGWLLDPPPLPESQAVPEGRAVSVFSLRKRATP